MAKTKKYPDLERANKLMDFHSLDLVFRFWIDATGCLDPEQHDAFMSLFDPKVIEKDRKCSALLDEVEKLNKELHLRLEEAVLDRIVYNGDAAYIAGVLMGARWQGASKGDLKKLAEAYAIYVEGGPREDFLGNLGDRFFIDETATLRNQRPGDNSPRRRKLKSAA